MQMDGSPAFAFYPGPLNGTHSAQQGSTTKKMLVAKVSSASAKTDDQQHDGTLLNFLGLELWGHILTESTMKAIMFLILLSVLAPE